MSLRNSSPTPNDRMSQLVAATWTELTRQKNKRLSVPWRSIARPNQLPPPGDWRIWLLLAGRGFGKTRTIVEFGHEQAEAMPGSRGALVGATAADTRDVLVLGESGLIATARPDFKPTYLSSKRLVVWPNGSQAMLFSADEPDRLRGLQHHWALADELAAWRRPEAWDMLLMTMRLGSNPRIGVATTPRPTKIIKALLTDDTVTVTRGTTYDNAANLARPFLDAIIRRYEGTRLGRQEIEAAILDDAIGALWSRDLLDENRVTDLPEMRRIVVGVDPQAAQGEQNAETGIVAVGLGVDGHGYVLDDATISGSPDTWGRAAVAQYHKLHADRMIGEVNNGGDMVEFTIRTVDNRVSFKKVHASRGKYTRAEPVAALYEQHKIHHVGMFPELEDQMAQWIPTDPVSPDRMDALVWAVHELMLDGPGELSFGDAPQGLAEFFGGIG